MLMAENLVNIYSKMESDEHSYKENSDDISSTVSKHPDETQTSDLNVKPEDQKATPGWNDPPNINFIPINNQKRFKRPVYVSPNTTLVSNTIKPIENLQSEKPPMTNVSVTSIVNSDSQSINKIVNEFYPEPSDDIKLEQILNHFNDILESNNKLNDKNISKRLKIIEDMWQNNKFTSTINSSLWKLSESLRTNDIETAEKLHVALMTESPGLCSSWMPAVRCIINLCSAQKN